MIDCSASAATKLAADGEAEHRRRRGEMTGKGHKQYAPQPGFQSVPAGRRQARGHARSPCTRHKPTGTRGRERGQGISDARRIAAAIAYEVTLLVDSDMSIKGYDDKKIVMSPRYIEDCPAIL